MLGDASFSLQRSANRRRRTKGVSGTLCINLLIVNTKSNGNKS